MEDGLVKSRGTWDSLVHGRRSSHDIVKGFPLPHPPTPQAKG